jgi:hypothetical protein
MAALQVCYRHCFFALPFLRITSKQATTVVRGTKGPPGNIELHKMKEWSANILRRFPSA